VSGLPLEEPITGREKPVSKFNQETRASGGLAANILLLLSRVRMVA